MAEKLAFYLETDVKKPIHELLSDREYKVMLMIARGSTAKEIAEELCLSLKTISTYRVRALHKMGLKNNAELTYYAFKQGLID